MSNNDRVARFSSGQGFVAALDQSGGSTAKALSIYGIDESECGSDDRMMELMHEYRVRMFVSPKFTSDWIVAAILFRRTVESEVDGLPTADFLWERKGVLPMMKIDVGLAEEDAGISLMKPIPDMRETLQWARERNVFGTKMRSVIHEPTGDGVERIVEQQFEFALAIAEQGLIPIVEPEVSISCERKAEAEDLLRDALMEKVGELPEETRIALKLTLPERPDHYADLIAHPRVLRTTALSGGYSKSEACRRLAQNGGMIASFSRALAEGLHRSMDDASFNARFGANVSEIHRASLA